MAPLYLQRHRVDEIDDRGCDHDETAQESTSLHDGCTDEPQATRGGSRIINLPRNVWLLSPGLASHVVAAEAVLIFHAGAAGTKIERKRKRRWLGLT